MSREQQQQQQNHSTPAAGQLSAQANKRNQDQPELLLSQSIVEGSSLNELDDPIVDSGGDDSDLDAAPDDDSSLRQRRILECRRLSEGLANNVRLSNARKNSLHMIDSGLPPVTEGKPMEHMSMMNNAADNDNDDPVSATDSINLKSMSNRFTLKEFKRSSFSNDEQQTASCSSSMSLEIDTSKRRNSSVSQCSSVLSEGTRNQLNFDLSPDLTLDSTLLEANSISPTTDMERPPSPEPSVGLFNLEFSRPQSRMSNEIDEDTRCSPDSILDTTRSSG